MGHINKFVAREDAMRAQFGVRQVADVVLPLELLDSRDCRVLLLRV